MDQRLKTVGVAVLCVAVLALGALYVAQSSAEAQTAPAWQPNTAYAAFVPLVIHISRRETAPHTLMQIA